MKETIQYLRDLSRHNDRVWFNENKPRWEATKTRWQAFCEELIREVGRFDEEIARLTLRDCTYRIYRDTRFCEDKSPYKTHLGVFLAPGGKKSMHAGYYFQVGTGESTGYPQGHMLAVGNYCYDPRAVKLLREDISDSWESFSKEILGAMDPRFRLDMEGALKRVPKGYAADAPFADWMRLRSYSLDAPVDEDFITRPHLARRVAELFRTAKPFNDFINRAVDFAAEGYEVGE